ncbi:unnamed protein product [Arabidopsis thaliana]|uniref:Transmembrane protein n=1 Tax=Arabidopsis thaliana TaxID=3702 RepID=Q9FFV6_ARATH|nr:unnamed protein product [Arabidopsis thaliana]
MFCIADFIWCYWARSRGFATLVSFLLPSLLLWVYVRFSIMDLFNRYGFGAYFTILPGTEWSAIMLTYGFPLSIIGMALKYAELKPVPCLSYSDAVKLRESCATPILTQVRNDVTRYRYGDEQHLEEALKRIFQYGLVLTDGRYCVVLVFEAKALTLSDFEKRQAKFTSFFGPNITAEVGKGESENLYEVRLISNLSTNSVSSTS